MKKKKKIQTYVAAVMIFVVFAGISGCASKGRLEELTERKEIIDDYAEIILQQDHDSARYDEALAAVDAYLEEYTPEQKEASLTILAETIRQMETDSDACVSYDVPESLAQMLQNQGISSVEYQMNAEARYASLQGFLQDLMYLKELLEYADEGDIFLEDLEHVDYFMKEEQKVVRAYQYTGINYWFAGWGEEEREYIRKQILNQLLSFSCVDAEWKDERDAVEARMNTWLDQLDEIKSAWAASVGESWEELNEMKEQTE